MLTEHVNIDVSPFLIVIMSDKWCLKNFSHWLTFCIKGICKLFALELSNLWKIVCLVVLTFSSYIYQLLISKLIIVIWLIFYYNRYMSHHYSLPDWHMPSSLMYTKGTHCFRVKPQSRTLHFSFPATDDLCNT